MRFIALFVLVAPVFVSCVKPSSSKVAGAGSCSYPAWQAGSFYPAGSKVVFQGNPYNAKHENPGYDPTISTWYWEPTQCSGAPANPSNGGGSCQQLPQWTQGTFYKAGDKVMYQGQVYVAEHENPGYDPIISSWFWEPSSCDSVAGGSQPPPPTGTENPPPPPAGNGSVSSLISEAQFNSMFPQKIPFYTYQGFIQAAETVPGFAKEGDTETRKREIAAILANADHESDHFKAVREYNTANYGHYCQADHATYPCKAGQAQYYGRGPIQLSWNYNYGAAGDYLKVDLLSNPDLVATDPKIAFMTMMWYWMTQKGPGTMTGHEAIVNGKGFGETIRSINGSLECNGRNSAQVNNRIAAYNTTLRALGASKGPGADGC